MSVICFMTQKSDVTFRPLTAADAAQWQLLQRKSLSERGMEPQGTSEEVLLAFIGANAVGFARFDRQHSDCTWERAFVMHDLHVLSAHADQGVGAGLVRAVYEAALSTGFPAVYWHSALTALRARPARPARSFVQKVA